MEPLAEFARLFQSLDAVIGLLARIGCPRDALPPMEGVAPLDYWKQVVEVLDKRLNPGGSDCLFREAADLYPYNQVLAPWRGLESLPDNRPASFAVVVHTVEPPTLERAHLIHDAAGSLSHGLEAPVAVRLEYILKNCARYRFHVSGMPAASANGFCEALEAELLGRDLASRVTLLPDQCLDYLLELVSVERLDGVRIGFLGVPASTRVEELAAAARQLCVGNITQGELPIHRWTPSWIMPSPRRPSEAASSMALEVIRTTRDGQEVCLEGATTLHTARIPDQDLLILRVPPEKPAARAALPARRESRPCNGAGEAMADSASPPPSRDLVDPALRDAEMHLIRGALSGDKAAQQQITITCLPAIRRTISTVLESRPAEDRTEVEQQSLMALFISLPRFRGDSALVHFARAIARNQALQFRTRAQRTWVAKEDPLNPDNRLYEWADPTPGPDRKSVTRDYLEALGERLMKLLSPSDQTLFQLYFVDGRSSKECAAILGIKENAVDQRIYRIRQKAALIRMNLDRESWLDDDA